MFSPKVTNTDKFLDMPVSARELYFQLGMNADDDGFITPKKIIRMLGAADDDLKVLITKGFVIPFNTGVIVITAWRINNLVRKDWYQETIYKDEKKLLTLDNNGEYKLVNELVNENVTNSLTQVRLGKVRKDKELLSVGTDEQHEICKNNNQTEEKDKKEVIKGKIPYDQIKTLYNTICANEQSILPMCRFLSEKRRKSILARFNDLLPTLDDWEKFFKVVAGSDFLMGKTKMHNGEPFRGVDFDWLINANNATKILEWKYENNRKWD